MVTFQQLPDTVFIGNGIKNLNDRIPAAFMYQRTAIGGAGDLLGQNLAVGGDAGQDLPLNRRAMTQQPCGRVLDGS